jgi:hypothetical protein
MKIALIQNASGPYVPLLEATIAHHRRYCERHGIAYLPTFGRFCHRHPNWDRFPLIRAAREFADATVWMDADCIIVDMETDLRNIFRSSSLSEAPIGLVKHTKIGWGHADWHFNCGVMAVFNTKSSATFLEHVWGIGDVPNEHQWKTQPAIHIAHIECGQDRIRRIDDRWNSTPWENDCERPVVRAFHGKGVAALPLMQAELGKL